MRVIDVAGHATPLKKYLDTCTQQALASRVGLTQVAISKMLYSGRSLWVIETRRKTEIYEWKHIAGGSQ